MRGFWSEVQRVYENLIVSTFRITAGDLDFELFGMRLKGAAGPVVLWVLVFLAMVSGVAVLWKDAA